MSLLQTWIRLKHFFTLLAFPPSFLKFETKKKNSPQFDRAYNIYFCAAYGKQIKLNRVFVFYIHSWLIFKLTLMQHTYTHTRITRLQAKKILKKKSVVLLFDLLVDIRHIWHNNYWHMWAHKTVWGNVQDESWHTKSSAFFFLYFSVEKLIDCEIENKLELEGTIKKI